MRMEHFAVVGRDEMDERKLIYADDAIRWVKIECNPYGKPTLDFESGKKVIEYLERLPSVQPEHLVKGLVNDCISRQAAKDALAKFVPYAICDESTESYTNGLTDAYNLICQLPSAQPRWIPVTEKLPEDGLYIVTTSKGQVQVHVFSHNGNSEEYWMRCNKAWMPLPEPYKEEQDD